MSGGYIYGKNMVSYADDAAAQAGEDEIVAGLGGGKYTDERFGPVGDSLYRDAFRPPRGAPPNDVIEWIRISDKKIQGMDDPVMFKGGVSAGDVIQGQLGDCWFISAMSVLATQPSLLKKVCVSARHLDKGIATFKFSKNGKWRYVHVTDEIPCSKSRVPMYARSKEPNEVWVMLMEKAYAKLHGSYENLISGFIDYGLRDLTGGACVKLKFADKRIRKLLAEDKLFDLLKKGVATGSLVGCSFSAKGAGVEHDRGAGILAGHAYGVLQVRSLEVEGEQMRFFQVRNPWGMREWTGDYSDNDVMWEDYPEVKEALNPGEFVNDGCFWITYDDFIEQFNQIFVCLDLPDEWQGTRYKGSWFVGNALSGPGGCPKFPSFKVNPQYSFTVEEPTRSIVIVSQQDNRWEKNNAKYTSAVGFVVMRVQENCRCTRFNPKQMVGMSRTFAPMRSVSGQFDLVPGHYAVIPCTFKPSQEDKRFLLEMYTSKEVRYWTDGDEIPDLEGEADDGEEVEGGVEFEEDEQEEEEEEEEGLALKHLQLTVGTLASDIAKLKDDIAELEGRL